MSVMVYDSRLMRIRRSLVGPELLTNGGFESYTGTVDDDTTDSFTGWTNNTVPGTSTQEATATSHTPSTGFKHVTTAATATLFFQDIVVVAEADYVLRFWARGDGVRAPRYSVYDLDNAGYIVAVTDTGITGTAYREIVKEFSAPAGCTNVRIQIYNANTATAHVVYVDDVSCRRNYSR